MPYPEFLLDDSGNPLPGIRSSLAGKLAFVECDGQHAQLRTSAVQRVYDGLVLSMGAENVPLGSVNSLYYFRHPADEAFSGLVLTSASFGSSTSALFDEVTLRNKGLLTSVQGAWQNRVCCVMGAAPCVFDFWKTGNANIIPQSLTSFGVSGSCETVSLYTGVAYAGLRADVADAYQAQGKLADTLKGIVFGEMWAYIHRQPDELLSGDMLKRKDQWFGVFTSRLFPTFTIKIIEPDLTIQRTKLREAHLDFAKVIARRANAITLDGPPPSTDMESYWLNVAKPAGVTTREFSDNYFRLKGK